MEKATAAVAAAKPAAPEPAVASVEEATNLDDYGFDKEWLKPLYEAYGKQELTNAVLSTGAPFRGLLPGLLTPGTRGAAWPPLPPDLIGFG